MDDEYIVIWAHPLEWNIWAYCKTLKEAKRKKIDFEKTNSAHSFMIYRREE